MDMTTQALTAVHFMIMCVRVQISTVCLKRGYEISMQWLLEDCHLVTE